MRTSVTLFTLACVMGTALPAGAVLPDQEPPKPRPKPTTKQPAPESPGRKEVFEMSGDWRLEYIDSQGCRFDGTLFVNTKIADGIYRGYQKHTMTCSGNEATQDALITIDGDDVKVQFSNPRTSNGSEYSADNYYLKRSTPTVLKGFNKDTRGNGRDVLLIKAR
jgi:hypothetical protein